MTDLHLIADKLDKLAMLLALIVINLSIIAWNANR